MRTLVSPCKKLKNTLAAVKKTKILKCGSNVALPVRTSSVWATLVSLCANSAVTLAGKSARQVTASNVGVPACNTSGLVTTKNVLEEERGMADYPFRVKLGESWAD